VVQQRELMCYVSERSVDEKASLIVHTLLFPHCLRVILASMSPPFNFMSELWACLVLKEGLFHFFLNLKVSLHICITIKINVLVLY